MDYMILSIFCASASLAAIMITAVFIVDVAEGNKWKKKKFIRGVISLILILIFLFLSAYILWDLKENGDVFEKETIEGMIVKDVKYGKDIKIIKDDTFEVIEISYNDAFDDMISGTSVQIEKVLVTKYGFQYTKYENPKIFSLPNGKTMEEILDKKQDEKQDAKQDERTIHSEIFN